MHTGRTEETTRTEEHPLDRGRDPDEEGTTVLVNLLHTTGEVAYSRLVKQVKVDQRAKIMEIRWLQLRTTHSWLMCPWPNIRSPGFSSEFRLLLGNKSGKFYTKRTGHPKNEYMIHCLHIAAAAGAQGELPFIASTISNPDEELWR